VKFFDGAPASKSLSTERLEQLLNSIRHGVAVAVAVREFLADALPRDNSPSNLQQSRAFLTWAIEHINLEVASMGAGSAGLATAKEQTLTAVLNSSTPFSACEAFGNYAKVAAQQVASIFADREQKIVLSVRQLIEERGVAQLTIQEIAAALRLSAGHLSRIYRRATGMTLEGFLIRQRVELAKRTLLDPRLNVAEVAERCGFCNPAYFAYVFKRYVNCTPRAFARRPHLSAQA
jgi:AraC-like DNA-binding protein